MSKSTVKRALTPANWDMVSHLFDLDRIKAIACPVTC